MALYWRDTEPGRADPRGLKATEGSSVWCHFRRLSMGHGALDSETVLILRAREGNSNESKINGQSSSVRGRCRFGPLGE